MRSLSLLMFLFLLTPSLPAADDTALAPSILAPADIQWRPGPGTIPVGTQFAVIQGDPTKPGPFAIRLRFPAGYRIPPHSHPVPEFLTVLSGSMHRGVGDSFDESKGQLVPTGGFAVTPAGVNHFVWTTEETVVQVHGFAPGGVTYVNPADDPRKK